MAKQEFSTKIYWEASNISYKTEPVAAIARELPIDELFNAIETSPFAESIQNPVRFKQRFYHPDLGDTDLTWTKWLNSHTRIFEHMRDTTKLAIAFYGLEGDRFSRREQILGIMAEPLHDLGEAEIEGLDYLGDIAAGLKTQQDEKQETVIAHQAISLLDLDFMESRQKGFRALLHKAYDDAVVGKDNDIHRAHKAREKWNYIETAIDLIALDSASDHSFSDTYYWYYSPVAYDWMVTRILAYDLPKVVNEYAREYPKSIGRFVDVNGMWLEAGFKQSQFFIQTCLKKYTPNIKDDYEDLARRLDVSFASWQQWLTDFGIEDPSNAWRERRDQLISDFHTQYS